MPSNIPTLSGESGLAVLRRMLRERSILAGLAAMHAHLGRIFQITLPNFRPVFLAGPDTNRHILVTHRHDFLWRTESDPVTHLLRHGLLVEDAESHDALRRQIDPPSSAAMSKPKSKPSGTAPATCSPPGRTAKPATCSSKCGKSPSSSSWMPSSA